MSHVIAVVNQKGGVGKTATVANVAWELVASGHSCLAVDLDPQGSLTISLGLNPDELAGRTIYEGMVLPPDHPQHRRLQPLPVELTGLALIPANLDLAAAELDLNTQYQREFALRRALAPLRETFEFIVIDCPPTLGILAINALAASDAVLIPVGTNYLSLRGLQLLLRSIRLIQQQINPSLQILGILGTLYDRRLAHHGDVMQELRRLFPPQGIPVFDSVIARSVRFEEAAMTGKPVVAYAPQNPGAEGYRQLTEEVLTYYGRQ
ncbi:MAG: sporulation initiation inhibitor Soj [Sulfobacillus benefaciens]|uniref:Sporulation initiation inhibitor protein Soj n=1 Tax=Sulfobacillus benefaciens TaxID=453960 RepID=A0A2T2WP29_9FIRM|nr:MAG: sporulation initiation inhibitor Soj [Sulfobacillus benefaciens]